MVLGTPFSPGLSWFFFFMFFPADLFLSDTSCNPQKALQNPTVRLYICIPLGWSCMPASIWVDLAACQSRWKSFPASPGPPPHSQLLAPSLIWEGPLCWVLLTPFPYWPSCSSMRRGKVLWELERVKWKHITETWCVEQSGGDEQRRRGQGENWTHAGRVCLGAVGE